MSSHLLGELLGDTAKRLANGRAKATGGASLLSSGSRSSRFLCGLDCVTSLLLLLRLFGNLLPLALSLVLGVVEVVICREELANSTDNGI